MSRKNTKTAARQQAETTPNEYQAILDSTSTANGLGLTLENAEHIGDEVLWALRDIRPTVSDFEAAMTASGYDAHTNERPALPSYSDALGRFLDHALTKHSDLRIVVCERGDGFKVWSLHRYEKRIDDHNRIARVGWFADEDDENAPGEVLASDGHHEVIDAAVAEWESWVARPWLDVEDVRSFLCDELRAMDRTKMRPSGGVWFVAARHAERLRCLRDLVATLPPGPSGRQAGIGVDPKFRLEETIDTLRMQAEQDLSGQISALRKHADKWREAGASNPRESTLLGKLHEAAELRSQLAFWIELVGDLGADLEGDLAAVTDTITAMLNDD